MVEQESVLTPPAGAQKTSDSGNSSDLLKEYLVEREIHNHLRFLERHLDASLLLERFKERLKKRADGGGRTGTESADSAKAGPDNVRNLSDDSEYILHLMENDPELVETAFRRRMVAEVYADLEQPECVERLNQAPQKTENLIAGLRMKMQRSQAENPSALADHPTAAARRRMTGGIATEGIESLLSRVLSQTSHPQLAAHQPSPCHEAAGFVRRKEVVNDGPDLRIKIRNYKDNPEKISFRLEGIVGAPLICILSVLNEVDLFSSWLPYFTTPFKLGLRAVTNVRLGRVDQVVQFHIDFPWPFANRDACFEVFAVDDFERNEQIVVKMLTLDEKQRTPRQKMTIPAPGRRVERMVVDGSMVIKPLTPTSSYLSLLWHEHCNMRVPLMMVDFVTKLFARSAFQAFRRTCESAVEGPLRVRRAENGFLYSFIQQRLADVGLAVDDVHSAATEEGGEELYDAEYKLT
ncbi:hypothetical protein Efla_003693 [Eimeria flavescens]